MKGMNENAAHHPHFSPSEPKLESLTIGSSQASTAAILAQRAEAGHATWPLRQIMSLASYDPGIHNSLYQLGAFLYFLTRPEILGILEIWKAENRHAANLLKLATSISNCPQIIRDLRPFEEDQRTSLRLRGIIEDEPLYALIASRRVVTQTHQNLAHWTEKLRLLLIIRGLELLEAGGKNDPHLTTVCAATRRVCEGSPNNQSLLFLKLVSNAEGFFDFQIDIKYLCKRIRSAGPRNNEHVLSDAEKKTLTNLQNISTGGVWWHQKSITKFEATNGDRMLGEKDPSLPERAPPFDLPSLSDEFEGIVGGVDRRMRLVAQGNSKVVTPAESRTHGQKILLRSVEHSLFLRSSWHRLSDHEAALVANQIQSLSQSETLVNRLGAALVLVAWVAARSVFDVETIVCCESITDDWTLDCSTGTMRRRPPRFERAISVNSLEAAAQTWMTERADQIEIQLSPKYSEAICDTASQRVGIENIADLWKIVSPHQRLDDWFNKEFTNRDGLRRLSGPSTAGALEAEIFTQSHDTVLALLLGSQTRTALPAACAYGSYLLNDVNQRYQSVSLSNLIEVQAPEDGIATELNGAGSELDADLARIASAIGKIIVRYEATATKQDQWVESHNLLVCIVAIALFACTGARPVNSPFESFAWLDLEQGVAYVEDKRSGPTTGARMCVLSKVTIAIIKEIYIPHLQALANFLGPSCPNMAAAIEKAMVSSFDDDRPLPFLFLFRGEPDFGWLEVTESQLTMLCGAEWPAPWNLFRHLQATHLIRRGLHSEIVDALLAHGDRGAESHGDFSMRIPREDIEAARPIIDGIQTDLGLRVPILRPNHPPRAGASYADLDRKQEKKFGAAARAQARAESFNMARQRATVEIEDLINGRPPSSLSAEEWQAIGRAMLFQNGHIPHPAASVRYEVLEEFLAKAWNSPDRTLTLLRRHYRPVPEPTPVFSPIVITAKTHLKASIDSFRLVTKGLDIGAGQPGAMTAGLLGAIELCLSCRISHPAMLIDIAKLRSNVQLVHFKNRYWLERANADKWQDGRPVIRVALNARAARWIGIALSATRRDLATVTIPPLIHKWVELHFPDAKNISTLFQKLCELQAQVNSWELCGVEAAHLSGRHIMAALPHHDWFRQYHRKSPSVPTRAIEDEEFEDMADVPDFPIRGSGKSLNQTTSAQRCATLLDGVTRAFEETGANAASIIAAARKLTKESGFAHGDAPQVLVHFACHLLTRNRKSGKKLRLRITTARRYWYSLVGPFVDLSHSVCLPDEDEESLREFYEDIIDWWSTHDKGILPAENLGVEKNLAHDSDENAKDADAFDATRRTITQLRDFHEFSRKTYSIEDVDWSGVGLGAKLAVGRPGLILDSEVGAALQCLLNAPDISALPDIQLSTSFVLVICARFGLRVSEAIGLFRDDWVEYEGAIVVLVQSNSIRSLKTAHSRRQIPLIGCLNPAERSAISEIIRRWELRHKNGVSAPLLPGLNTDSFGQLRGKISKTLLDLLKQVTCNQDARIHGLRHSYASQVLTLLCGVPDRPNITINWDDTANTRKLLLNSVQLDRRTLWSVSRLLGHGRPSTTIGSYLHVMEFISKSDCDGVEWDRSGITPNTIIDLDWKSLDAAYGKEPVLPAPDFLPSENLELRRARFVSMLAGGYNLEHSLERAKLSVEELDEFIELISLLPGHQGKDRSTLFESEIIRSISFPRWQELIKIIEEADYETEDSKSHPSFLLAPIGQRRQIVLHLRDHFMAAGHFIRTHKLTPDDVKVVPVKGLHTSKVQWILEAGLASHVLDLNDTPLELRVDAVEFGDPPEPVKNRASLTPSLSSKRRIQSTQELLLLWLITRRATKPFIF